MATTRRKIIWPTKQIPEPPVSAQTHGDPRGWTEEQWQLFRQWAKSLEQYPPIKEKK